MFDSLKNRLRKVEKRLDYLAEMQGENLASLQLQKLFGDGFFMPLTSWSISPAEVLHICNDIEVNNRRSIIEFGSGYSTLCMARMLQITGRDARLFSVESDASWFESMNDALKRNGLDEFVELIFAPVVDAPPEISMSEDGRWYDADILEKALKNVDSVDLVVVDGPFGSVSSHARYPAVPFLKSKLADRFSIFLDDATRPHERKIAERWKDLIGADPKDFGRYMYFTNSKGFDSEPYGKMSV
ncbi:MAG: class I SAM-dependent methyltransferase [Cryomorphaceae bacterium]